MSQPMMTNLSEQGNAVIDRQEPSVVAREAGSPPWMRVLIIFGILVVLTLPILWTRKLDVALGEDDHSQEGIYAVICEDANGITPQEEGFLQWLHFIDPSQWYYPSQEGFSGYKRLEPLPDPVLNGYTQQAHPLGDPAETTTALMAEIPPMNGGEFLKHPVFIEIPAAPCTAKNEALPARWRRLGGGALAKSPEFTPEELALLDNPGIQNKLLENNCLPTRLEVQFRSGIPLPRVLVRESCGVPELDRAALNALCRLLHTSGLSEQVFSPAVNVLLEIVWRQ